MADAMRAISLLHINPPTADTITCSLMVTINALMA
jgi:hypothetical protein